MPTKRFSFLFIIAIALQAVLFCSYGSSQKPGFLSLDCGSSSTSVYTDDDGIEWVSDSDQISEGTPMNVTGGSNLLLATMRLFNGTDQSKYCYNLTSNAVEAGAFFLVRASIWASPPYTPKSPDGNFRFKMFVDADEWLDVSVDYGYADFWRYELYMRAKRSSIDVCFARSTPNGDAPFVSALELRPLPATLTSTIFMNTTDRIFITQGHSDYGVPSTGGSYTRYPSDPFDRIWIAYEASESYLNATSEAIDTSDDVDQPPMKILQDTFTADPYFTSTWTELEAGSKHYARFYFAEIDPAVNASGLRVFNIFANGELVTTDGAIDVFAQVGANAAYSYGAVVTPNATGAIVFNFTPIATSIFPPFAAAAELFNTRVTNALTSDSIVSVVEVIKNSFGLSSYTGDPCLPTGYGYPWLNCSTGAASGITELLLSNYKTGGKIPADINNLTTLTAVYLNGNDLEGEIPDLTALANLKILDLRNNKLNGSIPSYFATLQNLKALYLQNNHLSGEIPAALLQRKRASLLTFEFSGNRLCDADAGECSPSPGALLGPISKKRNVGITVGVAVAGFLLVGIAIGIAVYCYCNRNRRSPSNKTTDSYQPPAAQQELPQVQDSAVTVIPVINRVIPKLSVQHFSFQEIKMATDNFCAQLGQGRFGPVYKGCLKDGRLVAIKVSSSLSNQGSKEFMTEVDLLSRVRHRNVVELIGYSNEENLALVYEFMSNGSLFDRLHGPLPWATRLSIIVDAARGLDYLHEGCKPRIIHRDVKSSNVLLNDQMEAKISDFGISRDKIMGETSLGYVDHEYLSTMNLTERIDVYSFGVLLLEVVCGRTAMFNSSSSQQRINIVNWAKASIGHGVIDDIVDVSLHGQYDVSSAWKVLEVALACVEMPSLKWPKMSEVYQELREAKQLEARCNERYAIDTPSMTTTSLTNVNVR